MVKNRSINTRWIGAFIAAFFGILVVWSAVLHASQPMTNLFPDLEHATAIDYIYFSKTNAAQEVSTVLIHDEATIQAFLGRLSQTKMRYDGHADGVTIDPIVYSATMVYQTPSASPAHGDFLVDTHGYAYGDGGQRFRITQGDHALLNSLADLAWQPLS